MPCLGPSAEEIASANARNNENVHSLLRRVTGKTPPEFITEQRALELWWNNGKPKPADKNSLDYHTELLCTLCGKLEKSSWQELIDKTNGLREWWAEHQRLDAERTARKKATQARNRTLRALKNKLKAANLTPEEIAEFGHYSINSLLSMK